jgi:hypothetical protein
MPDAGLITMTEMVENAKRICDVTQIPVILGYETLPHAGGIYGARVVLTLGVMFFEAGLIADYEMLKNMKEKGLEYWYDWREKAQGHPASWQRIYDLVGFPEVRAWEEKYLPQEQLGKYDRSGGLYEPR